MFGSNNAQVSNDDPAMLDSVKQLAEDPQVATATQSTQAFQPSTPPNATQTQTADSSAPSAHPEPAPGFSSMPAPSSDPVATTPATPEPTQAVTTPPAVASVAGPSDNTQANPVTVQDNATPASAPVDHQQLAGMKQHALDHLEPLVNHLEQSAEEEFKTTMMMIQSNDNHTLLEKALDAAKRISDDKARAEALLDIINEINYFASQNTQD